MTLLGVLCLSPAQGATAKDTNPQLMLSKMVNTTDYKCLSTIIEAESSWNTQAISKTKDYGLPQRHMPGYTRKQLKGWMQDTYKQLTWMITYTHTRYGSPCKALEARKIKGWY
jgi:hypothetical protein